MKDHKKKKSGMSRRKFLGQSSCAALGYTTLFSSLLNLKAFEAAAVGNASMPVTGTYKAMICLMLGGGNDSYNMLIPAGSGYSDYAVTRSNLAIPVGNLLPISPSNIPGAAFGLHPSMPEVKALFDQQKIGFISNVGTLVEPTTRDQYYSGIHRLPLGLQSHSDQYQQWQTGRPHERSAYGWGGRVADLVQSMNSNENISMNISLSGNNTMQRGQSISEYTINQEGSLGIEGVNPNSAWIGETSRISGIDNLLDATYSDIYKNTYVNTIKSSRQAGAEFQEAIESIPEFAHQFGDNELSDDFKMIAKTIAAREQLGFERQIFFVDYGGWDHHDEVLQNQAGMLAEVSRALGDLQAALEELGVDDCVTTFTVSDFARTLTSNGNGTDHAWGGNALVMGGANLNGGQIYGQYPSLVTGLANPLDLGDGVLIPTTSADEYMAELALWFGVSTGEVNDILPNLVNFYDTASSQLPLGFLNL